MAVILGIDIGGSTTKIVGLLEDKSILGMQRVKTESPITSLYGALGSFTPAWAPPMWRATSTASPP